MLFALSAFLIPNTLMAQTAGQSAASFDDSQPVLEQRNDCVRYLEDTRSPERHHTQMPHRPLFFEGPLGTQVLVPEDAFVHTDGSPVNGEVDVVLTEVVDKPGMILNNLPTNSNGRMLVSGGVISIQALADGKRLKLAAGKSVLVNFPMGYEEGMELFKGKYDAAGTLDWVPMASSANANKKRNANLASAKAGPVPAFLDFGKVNHETFKFEQDNKDVREYIKAMLRANYACVGSDAVYIEISVGENGRPSEVRTLTGKNPCYRLAVEEIVMTLAFEPSIAGKQYYYELKPIIPQLHKEGENLFKPALGRSDLENNPALRKVLAQYIEEENAKNFARNAFEVTEMGLINCDRFYGEEGKRVSVVAGVNNNGREGHTKAFLVFDELNSAMEGQRTADSEYTFRNIPEGMNAKVVMIGFSPDEGPSLSVAKVTTKAGKVGVMNLESVTDEELRKAMAGL